MPSLHVGSLTITVKFPLNLSSISQLYLFDCIGDPGRWVLQERRGQVEELFDLTARYELNNTGT